MISKRIYLPECTSTQAAAAALIQQGQPQHGTLLHTDHQTQGYGMNGHAWESQKAKNLTFTLLLCPSFLDASQLFRLHIMASLAMLDALSSVALPALSIKWPNDILCRHKKICGILVESKLMQQHIRWSLLGIGLNVHQKKFHTPQATSLACEQKSTRTRNAWLERCLQALSSRYEALEQGGYPTLREDYLKHLYRKDSWHGYTVQGKRFQGKIIDIDDNGALNMQTHEGKKCFFSKEITYES